jgi:hypothetical protein
MRARANGKRFSNEGGSGGTAPGLFDINVSHMFNGLDHNRPHETDGSGQAFSNPAKRREWNHEQR